jgi:hypothetical protein
MESKKPKVLFTKIRSQNPRPFNFFYFTYKIVESFKPKAEENPKAKS